MKIRIIGFLFFLFVVVGTISFGGELDIFVNLPGIVIVAAIAGGLTVMRYRAGAGKLQIVKSLKKYSMLSGVMACLIGLIQVAMGFRADSWVGFFQGIAVCLVMIFYGLGHFNIFCSHLGRREDKADKEENATLLVVG